MKTQVFLSITVVLFVSLLSCKKYIVGSTGQIAVQQVDVTKLSDSCSYTLDGVTYICNTSYSAGKGNAGANLDTTLGGWKWDGDTLQYRISYSIMGSSIINGAQPGDLTITFTKKFAKNQLTRTVGPGIFGPISDTLLFYPKGNYPYSVDYSRFNRQNGVMLEVITGRLGNVVTKMCSYSSQLVSLPTTITNNSQKDSKFEITNIYWFPANGTWLDSHILEAKFTANVFDQNEQTHRIENGYIRIHID